MLNLKKITLLACLSLTGNTAFALSEAQCAYLKPVDTPEMRLYCSQPGHSCVTNPLPYLQCLKQPATTTPPPTRSCGLGTLNPSCKIPGGIGGRP